MQNEQVPVYTGTGAIQHPPEAYVNDKSTYVNQGQPLQPQQQQQFVGQYINATPLASLQQVPALVDCPKCRVRQMTVVQEEVGGYTHGMAAIACFCCCLGCIPYMMGIFKNVQHKCGNCGANLALYHRSGSTEVQASAAQ